ncbi:MAG: YicC/YloC family endoribonuclease [Betaproteobacteria bacterium]
MTGYAAASADSPRGTVGVELRSVNSRFLDLAFRLSDELRALEPVLRETLAARLARGKVECRLYVGADGAALTERRLDAAAMARLQALAAEARKAFPDAAPLSVADVLRWPGVVGEPALDEEGTRALARELCAKALDELVATREHEGARLAAAITKRTAQMRKRLQALEPLLPEALATYEARLAERLREALAGSVDAERLRAEVALFAQKSDVEEELTRLRTHLDEVERTLAKGGAAGKRLDFLAQELNREANTLAAKSASAAISECALELKLLVEQIREQVQNIE